MTEEVAAPTEAVIEPQAPKTPELGSQTPVAEKPEAEPEKKEAPKSNSDALKAASERLKAKAEAEKANPPKQEKTEAKAEPKADTKPEKTRDDTGKFQSTNAEVKATVAPEPKAEAAAPERRVSLEAPARFNENGKKDWATTPDSVKEEVYRTYKNLEDGYGKHKESAERYELVREYDELARKNGREGVHESLKQIREIEQTFERNPIEGLKKITDHFGLNLQAVAAHIMGQNPNQQVQEAHSRVRELEAKIQQMETAAKVPSIVEQFFTEHEDAKDYSDDIAFVLEQGIVKDLEAAYQYVKRFKPASSAPSAASSAPLAEAPASSAPALNPAGSKSVSGAPTGGVSPAAKHPVPANTREALQRAMARTRA